MITSLYIMHITSKKVILNLLVPLALLACDSLFASTVVYNEDFSASVLPTQAQGTLGFFNGNINFNEIGVSSQATIASEELVVNTTSNFRGIGIALAPDSFFGQGIYEVAFDITNYSGDANDFAEVGVYSGRGYEFGNNADALLLNTQTGQLTGLGSAVAEEIRIETFTSIGRKSFTFEYDGTSAVALFFGGRTGGFPFPDVSFDDISVTSVQDDNIAFVVVPEPSSALLVGCSAVFLFRRRRA